MLQPKLFNSLEELAIFYFLVLYELTFLIVPLDIVHVGVVILVNEVIAWKGGLQEIVPQDEEVEPELKAVAISVLQVDGALIVLALVVPFDVGA